MAHSQTSFAHVGTASHGYRSADSDQRPRSTSDGAAASKTHTLTACVRCRRGKQDATRACLAVAHASEATPSANTLIHPKANVYPERMSNIFKIGCSHWRRNWSGYQRINVSPDVEYMARGTGYVRFKENDESRYLGPSSGIAVSAVLV